MYSVQTPKLPFKILLGQWGRRLEGWSNMAARLASWRRVAQQGVILYVMDGPCRLPSNHTICPSLELIYYWMYSTQNTVGSYVKQGRQGLYSSRSMPSLCVDHKRLPQHYLWLSADPLSSVASSTLPHVKGFLPHSYTPAIIDRNYYLSLISTLLSFSFWVFCSTVLVQ